MISGDFTMPLPETISPRLLVGFWKTAYVGISTGPADCVRGISDFIGAGLGGEIRGTTGGRQQT